MTNQKLDRRFRIGFTVLVVASSCAISLSGWALYSRFQQTNQLRTADNRVWHAVVCTIEQAVLRTHLPARKERAALRFYDHLLTADVGTDGCGLLKKGTP